MQRYDVALWLTSFSWWPDYVAFVQDNVASRAIMEVMGIYCLQRVYKAAVNVGDGRVHRWWDLECLSSETPYEQL